MRDQIPTPPGDGGLSLALQAAGGIPALAAVLGITREGARKLRHLHAERVLMVERAFGIPRHELRPDLFAGYIKAQPPKPSGQP